MRIDNNIAWAISNLLEKAVEKNYTIKQFIAQVKRLDDNTEDMDTPASTDELKEQRRLAKNKNEYQRLTYQLNKQNKPEVYTYDFGDGTLEECITSKTLFINILNYSKKPSEEFIRYYRDYVMFTTEFDGIDYCILSSVLYLLHIACNRYYSEDQIRELLLKNDFNIFITPADFMREIEVSSTKSLRIRIERYNKENNDQIVPFNFYVKGENEPPKVLYLKKDLIKLLQ